MLFFILSCVEAESLIGKQFPYLEGQKRRGERKGFVEAFRSSLYLLQDDSGSADLVSCDFHPDPSVYPEHSPEWMGLMAALLAVVWHGI